MKINLAILLLALSLYSCAQNNIIPDDCKNLLLRDDDYYLHLSENRLDEINIGLEFRSNDFIAFLDYN